MGLRLLNLAYPPLSLLIFTIFGYGRTPKPAGEMPMSPKNRATGPPLIASSGDHAGFVKSWRNSRVGSRGLVATRGDGVEPILVKNEPTTPILPHGVVLPSVWNMSPLGETSQTPAGHYILHVEQAEVQVVNNGTPSDQNEYVAPTGRNDNVKNYVLCHDCLGFWGKKMT